jgi:hypothetical protein
MLYEEVREGLKNLLFELGPQRANYSPEDLFVWLTNDGTWSTSDLEKLNTIKDWIEREL